MEVLEYFPAGHFVWRKTLGQRAGSGKRAGSVRHASGYRTIQIDGVSYRESHLVWFYLHGEWPSGQILYRDMEKNNLTPTNLVDGDNFKNAQRQTEAHFNNKTGLRGVYKKPDCNRWVAQISVNKKQIYLGCFKSPEIAQAAYLDAKKRLHYSAGMLSK